MSIGTRNDNVVTTKNYTIFTFNCWRRSIHEHAHTLPMQYCLPCIL